LLDHIGRRAVFQLGDVGRDGALALAGQFRKSLNALNDAVGACWTN